MLLQAVNFTGYRLIRRTLDIPGNLTHFHIKESALSHTQKVRVVGTQNGVMAAILGTLSNENLDVPNVKNSNRKLIFSLLQCFNSKNSYSEALRFVV